MGYNNENFGAQDERPGGLGVYGDGSDGAITYSSNTDLTGDVYASAITVESGVVVNAAGFRIFCTGTLLNLGTIKATPNDASAGTGGTELRTGTMQCDGEAGGDGTVGGGNNGVSGATAGIGGDGGNGGSGAAGGGGTGGANSFAATTYTKPQALPFALIGNIISNGAYRYSIGCGGGGAGGNGAAVGGGGGGGGQIMAIAAKTINNAAGTITAPGGAGGAGQGVNTGGGGGGGGGVAILVYDELIAGTETAPGGAGGAGDGTGTTGADGSDGSVIKISNR